MAEYTKSDFDRMQRDAIHRARSMHERAGKMYGETSVPDFVRLPSRPLESHDNRPAETPKSKKSDKGFNLLKMINLKDIDIDSDRSLILMMLALLSGEGGDELLMLALLYLML